MSFFGTFERMLIDAASSGRITCDGEHVHSYRLNGEPVDIDTCGMITFLVLDGYLHDPDTHRAALAVTDAGREAAIR